MLVTTTQDYHALCHKHLDDKNHGWYMASQTHQTRSEETQTSTEKVHAHDAEEGNYIQVSFRIVATPTTGLVSSTSAEDKDDRCRKKLSKYADLSDGEFNGSDDDEE